MIERRRRVTPLWPGSFYPEEGSPRFVDLVVSDAAIMAEFADQRGWFALQIETSLWEKWTTDDGKSKWEPVPGQQRTTRRIYIGEVLDADAVAILPGDHHILLANMRGNGWDRVVRTRAGNFQPLNDGDVVVLESVLRA